MRAQVFILLFSFIFSASSAIAQDFHAGFIAGVNASQISGDGYGGFDKAGLLLGVYSEVSLSQDLKALLEINYSQKGSRRNPSTDQGITEFFLLRLDYVEIPLMLKYQKNKFEFEAGAYYSQLVNEYLEDENGEFEIPTSLNQFKSSDIGGLAGLNYNFTDHLIMNWRFSTSFLPVREYDSGSSFLFDNGMFHSYISISLRYEFYSPNE